MLILFGFVPGMQCFDLATFESEAACEARLEQLMSDAHYRPMGAFCVVLKDGDEGSEGPQDRPEQEMVRSVSG